MEGYLAAEAINQVKRVAAWLHYAKLAEPTWKTILAETITKSNWRWRGYTDIHLVEHYPAVRESKRYSG